MKIEVAPKIEKAVTDLVKIGIGTEAQFGALYAAGAEDALTHERVRQLIVDDRDLLGPMFRAKDVIVMVQPNLLNTKELGLLARIVENFEVPECGEFRLQTDENIRLFRKLKPKLEGVARVENRGALRKYPEPTPEQMERMIDWFRSKQKPDEVVDKVSRMLDAPVKFHWVRDQVKKHTGSAARKVK